MDAKIYSNEGNEVGKVSLPETLFGVEWNADLVHEVVVGMQANARLSTANTKGRGDVRGGGKKPWKQKGTGRARHGSNRSPIWAGGGVAHGPKKEKDYSVKINKKVRIKALVTVLSKKLSDSEIIFVDSLALTEPKASKGKQIIAALAKGSGQATLATKRKNAALVILPGRNEEAELSFRNFGNIEVIQAKDINPVDLLTYKFVVMAEPDNTIEIISKRVSNPVVAVKK